MIRPLPITRSATEHRVCRPAWVCAVDGAAWPCLPAREALTHAYRADPTRLPAELAALMAQAAIDLRFTDPARLYRRFLAWTLPEDRTCRVCGKAGHDAVPGIPPRLVPCESAARLVRMDR